jgi:ABC-type molybdate transport system substrate-binding protein
MNSHYNIVSTLIKKGFRKRHHSVYLQTGILVFVFYSLCLSQITAAVAANMQYAMDEICILFTKKHKIKVTPVYGG